MGAGVFVGEEPVNSGSAPSSESDVSSALNSMTTGRSAIHDQRSCLGPKD